MPLDAAEISRWIADEHRGDLFDAARQAAVLPQDGVARDQAMQTLAVTSLLSVDVRLEKRRELATGLPGRIDRDRLPDLDPPQRDVAVALEILVARRIIGVIDPPCGRRVQPTSPAVRMDEQLLPGGSAWNCSRVNGRNSKATTTSPGANSRAA